MNEHLINLPPELGQKFLGFLREGEEGDFEVVDKLGLIKFIGDHGEQYPFLYQLIQLNEEAVVEHFKQTGEVPPGVKLVQTTAHEGTNLTEFRVFHGPSSKS